MNREHPGQPLIESNFGKIDLWTNSISDRPWITLRPLKTWNLVWTPWTKSWKSQSLRWSQFRIFSWKQVSNFKRALYLEVCKRFFIDESRYIHLW